MSEYNFTKFDMGITAPHTTMVFVGKRKSGKSMLVLDWLYHHLDIPVVVVLSPTDCYTNTFSPHVPGIFIHNKINSDILKEIWARQDHLVRKIESGDPAYQHVDPRMVLILDDCLADSDKWVNDETIKGIFFNGRHLKITLIITMQDPMGIPPRLRTNVEYAFLCRDPRVTNQDKIWQHYAGVFPNKKKFRNIMNKMTQNYQCMVIDSTSISYQVEDCVFWYKANLQQPGFATFKTCCPKYWQLDQQVKSLPTDKYVTEESNSLCVNLLDRKGDRVDKKSKQRS